MALGFRVRAKFSLRAPTEFPPLWRELKQDDIELNKDLIITTVIENRLSKSVFWQFIDFYQEKLWETFLFLQRNTVLDKFMQQGSNYDKMLFNRHN